MNFFFSIISLAVIGAFIILIAIKRERFNYSILELLSLSILLGIGFIAYQFFLYYLLGISFNFLNLIIVPLALLLLMFARYASKPEKLSDFKPNIVNVRRWTKTERLLAFGVFIQLVWIVFLVMPSPVSSHDAVANYGLKAKIFFYTAGIPKGFFSWNESIVSHPDYPLLLPFLMTWIYSFTGFNDFIVNMIMPVICLTFIILLYALLKKLFTRAYSLLIVFILATIPQFADYATIIHADLILAAFVTCAFAYFLFYVRSRSRTYIVLTALLFGFSIWTKNEAIVFVGAFILVFIALMLRSDRSLRRNMISDLIICLSIIAVLSVPWFFVKALYGTPNSDINLSSLTLKRLSQNIKDIPILLDLFQQEVFGPKKWNIFWIIFFTSLVWKRKSLFKNENFYITLFLIVSVAGYFMGYMCTTANNLFFYANTTISRFMLHFLPLALLLLAFLLKNDIREIPSFHEVYETR